ncbi:Glycosyl transferase, group 1 [Trichormus variabilis ATCC 29413]|uniref:Glycosyl transferase, group 1 n=2 Tax=Anabaena variabilis TaxID=264691 RepID=Q3MEX0_TRIV2|nr:MULTISPECIES: glycosyltransferase [Nostocaceae]ABA20466.1 Glycosyl transferase, group 1 [Trichormus variabilis ATCC 29413]MBC1215809.1 glycosyltransferase [Trichormus variabilis ARAD]MBC1256857.1 glycosyltransferase [Trichormus variabilis V5]MBC1267987.1 glycosyltransferase [Trichormus variabilis FSR]MBC1304383.1 glycosyltransferase [Trichormus variabilis N2B]
MTQQVINSTSKNHLSPLENQKRYRVVLVHPSAGVNWSGGSEIFAIELARHLNSYFNVELLSGADCGSFSFPSGGISRTQAFNIVRHPLISKLLSRFASHPEIVIEHLSNFFPCAIQLLTKSADLIFPCNDYGGMAMAAFVRAIKGTPILFTEHVGLLGGGKSLTRNLRFHPDQLVVFSEAMAEFVRSVQPQQKVSIIPNGVDINRFTPVGNYINFGLPKPIVLCVASLKRHSHKRIGLAMEAVARLPQISLLLCGDGIDRDYFQAKGDELLGKERFKIQSFPYEQMPTVYRSADVFTLPSIDEPFGLAYVEAMASGLPVIATDDEMRRQIVGDAGRLCDVTNPDIYAAAIREILTQDWQVRARQKALGFSWENIALRYRELILKTIQGDQQNH